MHGFIHLQDWDKSSRGKQDCQEQIDMVALAAKEPIFFYDEVCNLLIGDS